MITEKEKEEIIDTAVERALLMLPEVVANLFKEKIALKNLAENFFKSNPEFEKHKDIVASTIQQIEGRNPGKKYVDVLREAEPEIKKRIGLVSNVDFSSVERPSRLRLDQ